MILIQPVLIFCLLCAGILFLRYFSNHFLGRLFVIAAGSVVLFFLLFPGTTNHVAHFLGVGRGVDMLFYLTNAFLLLLVGLLYAKIKAHQTLLTSLVRELALQKAFADAGEHARQTEAD